MCKALRGGRTWGTLPLRRNATNLPPTVLAVCTVTLKSILISTTRGRDSDPGRSIELVREVFPSSEGTRAFPTASGAGFSHLCTAGGAAPPGTGIG